MAKRRAGSLPWWERHYYLIIDSRVTYKGGLEIVEYPMLDHPDITVLAEGKYMKMRDLYDAHAEMLRAIGAIFD